MNYLSLSFVNTPQLSISLTSAQSVDTSVLCAGYLDLSMKRLLSQVLYGSGMLDRWLDGHNKSLPVRASAWLRR